MNIKWYITRLRVIGFREILHRVREQFDLWVIGFGQLIRDRSVTSYQPADFHFCGSIEPQLPTMVWRLGDIALNAEGLLKGDCMALGFAWQWQGSADWHVAPDTGREWPQNFFGTISYRQGNPYGDIRVAWEPSRLQQLVSLALLAMNDRCREEAVKQFERHLLSWLEANPGYRGIHYVSAMECGLRLIAVCHAVDMMRPHFKQPEKIWAGVLSLVDSHASFIIRRLSLYSSAGNHTIAECTGLVYAGTLFPELKGAKKWVAIARPLLEQEIDRQIVPDGGGIEQSTWYHFLTTDLAMLSASILRHYNQPSPIIEAAVSRGRRFLQALSNTPEGLPLIGDSDSGYALSKYARLSFADIEKSTTLPDFHSFESSGLTYIKQRQDSALYFKHGPFGMAPAYGHGHADALSVLLTSQGQPLLIDTGTFTYTGSQEWRSYFRSTRAHNTVAIEGGDQAKQVSAFMWSNTGSANLIASGESNGLRYVCAEVRTTEPQSTLHRRCCIELGLDSWLIWDYAETTALAATLCWHVDIELTQLDTTSLCSTEAAKPFSMSVQGGEVAIFRGSNDPIAGWKSTRYGVKQVVSTIQCSHRGAFPHEFSTIISSGELKPTETALHNAQLLIQKLKCKAK